ncbi:uncharacterized protein LOC143149619 [Ptiloglossa arizonensis]|uniref:uncharacterized protein LOC143149619 n=1 Tax=Ptiloglossa arizonensis TaxID=3350558 RepID=UPI003F9EC524
MPDKIMGEMRDHFRHLMLYKFQKGNMTKVRQITFVSFMRKVDSYVQKMYHGPNIQSRRTKTEFVMCVVNETRNLSVREMSQMLNISKSCVHKHLKKMGMMPKLDVWIPHQLTKRNNLDRVAICICILLLACNETEPFQKRTVIRDEK